MISSEITFAFNSVRKEINEKHNEHKEEKRLCTNQELTHWRYWIVIAKSDCNRSDKGEINRIEPMRKRLVEIVSSRVNQSERKNNLKIVNQQQQH
jgi:hypothetical protein